MLWQSLGNKSWGHVVSRILHDQVKSRSKKYLKKFSILPKVTVESRVWYQADVNFQDLSEVVWVAVSINQKTLNYDIQPKETDELL